MQGTRRIALGVVSGVESREELRLLGLFLRETWQLYKGVGLEVPLAIVTRVGVPGTQHRMDTDDAVWFIAFSFLPCRYNVRTPNT
jgi:hypothetical protein